MTNLHTIVREVSQITMAMGVLFWSFYLLHTKARHAADEREQKANVQTLFNGKK